MEQPRRYFLIIGNGRTGSTWLTTSLNQLSDTVIRGEMKWRVPHEPVHALHIDIGPDTRSLEDEINAAYGDASEPCRGAKLIFSPYWYMAPSIFQKLARTMRPTGRFVILKRGYLDCWLSWKARGVYHEVSAAHDNEAMEKYKLPKPEEQHLVLHHGGAALSAYEETALAYPLETAIDDLLSFFSNDVLAVDTFRDALVVDYADIASRLPEIAAFVGSRAEGEEIESVLENPAVKKLRPLKNYLHPYETLASVGDVLDDLFWQAVDGARPVEWHEGMLKIGGLEKALGALGVAMAPNATWRPQKPLISL